jgi:hypothetical protein
MKLSREIYRRGAETGRYFTITAPLHLCGYNCICITSYEYEENTPRPEEKEEKRI